MPKTVAISQLKARCLRLVDDVARRHHELVITKRGKPIARLVPMGDAPIEQALSELRGSLVAGGVTVGDFDTGSLWRAARR